jgi:hypothetical protein
MWSRVFWYIFVPTLRKKMLSEFSARLPWKWSQQILQNLWWKSVKLHGFTFRRTVIFVVVIWQPHRSLRISVHLIFTWPASTYSFCGFKISAPRVSLISLSFVSVCNFLLSFFLRLSLYIRCTCLNHFLFSIITFCLYLLSSCVKFYCYRCLYNVWPSTCEANTDTRVCAHIFNGAMEIVSPMCLQIDRVYFLKFFEFLTEHLWNNLYIYRVFQKELYNFESL